ncbi:MAG: hypothetical protein RXR02_07495 [Thermoproteus sp.]
MKTCVKVFRQAAEALDDCKDFRRFAALAEEAERRRGREEFFSYMAELVLPRVAPYFADETLALYRRLKVVGHPSSWRLCTTCGTTWAYSRPIAGLRRRPPW